MPGYDIVANLLLGMIKEQQNTKKEIRSFVKRQKTFYSKAQFEKWSDCIQAFLLDDDAVIKSKTILLYYSLPDEVATHKLIDELADEKLVLLPVVCGEDLKLRVYNHDMFEGSFHIMEPNGEEYTDYDNIDLVIVPGVAFDKKRNRLGRGKGYYDRLLPQIKAKKIGVCFGFQIVDDIPCEKHDIAMNAVVTENGYL